MLHVEKHRIQKLWIHALRFPGGVVVPGQRLRRNETAVQQYFPASGRRLTTTRIQQAVKQPLTVAVSAEARDDLVPTGFMHARRQAASVRVRFRYHEHNNIIVFWGNQALMQPVPRYQPSRPLADASEGDGVPVPSTRINSGCIQPESKERNQTVCNRPEHGIQFQVEAPGEWTVERHDLPDACQGQ